MSIEFRALFAELVSEIQALRRAVADEVGGPSPEPSVIARALAALAQTEPVAPTESDVTELFYRHMGEGSHWCVGLDGHVSWVGFKNAIAEALARWGTPTNTIPQGDYE
jgi:hypothetical protein